MKTANDNLSGWASVEDMQRTRRSDGYIRALSRVFAWITAIVILGLIALGMQA